jgi:hypothetical protein
LAGFDSITSGKTTNGCSGGGTIVGAVMMGEMIGVSTGLRAEVWCSMVNFDCGRNEKFSDRKFQHLYALVCNTTPL